MAALSVENQILKLTLQGFIIPTDLDEFLAVQAIFIKFSVFQGEW